MNKKILAVLLSAALIITAFPASIFASIEFSDMPTNWSTAALQKAVSNGLLNGANGKIMPNNNLTRAQMAAVVNRAFGTTEKVNISKFIDVSPIAWYYDDMAKAVQMQTFQGDGNRLNPESNITREEAFVVLSRAFKLSGANLSVLSQFKDNALVSAWAKDGVASLVAGGYVNGSNGMLNPKQNINRAEFAQIMENMVKGYIKEAGIYSSIPEGNVMINVADVTLKDVTVVGDLIIGDGVGDGDVTLDNVTVTGRTIIRGGGENSIKITGNSKIQNIFIVRVDGRIRVLAEDGTDVGEVVVDGNDDVIIEGVIGTITVIAADIQVSANNATIKNVNISASNSKFVVSANSTVKKVTIHAEDSDVEILGEVKNIETTKQAENARINVRDGGSVENVEVNSEGTIIEGKGIVKSVEAKANNIEVNTKDTNVIVDKGVSGVKVDGKEVEPGKEEKKGGSGGAKPDPDPDPEEPNEAEFLAFINKYSEILNIADEDIDLSHIRAIGELREDLSYLSEKNIEKFTLEYGERFNEIEDICLIYRWTRDVQLTDDEANMRELFNLLASLKLDDTNVFDSLSDIQQTEIAEIFILTRPEETELSQDLFNLYTDLIREKTLNYLEILNNINNGSYNTRVTELGSLGELIDIELNEEEIHILIVLTPPEGYESISQIVETLESLDSIEYDYTFEGKYYVVSYDAIKENELSTLTVDSYEVITRFISWLEHGLSSEAYNYIDGDSIRTELNNMMNDLMDYVLEEYTYTTDIDILSELTAKVLNWYSLEVKTKLDDLSRLFILVREDIVTYEFSDLNQVEETLTIADEIMWDVIEAANYAEDIEELRTLLDEYFSLTSTNFSDVQLENILTNPLRGRYFELTEVLIAAAGDIEEGLDYLEMFESIMEYELSTIELRDYFYIEELLSVLDELNMDSYNYIDGDTIREILNELMDEVMPLIESALLEFSNSNDANIISEIAQQIFQWYSDPIMFDDLSDIFIYLRDASGPIEYTNLDDVGDVLWAASEIMEDVIDTTNAAANIEELREGLKSYMELTSTEFEDGELENILTNKPSEGYKSLTEVLNGAAYR